METLHPRILAKAAHLKTSKREIIIEYHVAVYPHNPRTNRPRYCVCNVQIVRHHSRCQSILTRVTSLDRLLNRPAYIISLINLNLTLNLTLTCIYLIPQYRYYYLLEFHN